ncbi:MAG TPA: hypothetical protein VIV40_31855 [Kofleriaceae bacterium]
MTTRTVIAVLAMVACSAPVRRFPLRAPLTVDPDTTPFLPPPKEYKTPQVWDTIDNTLFGPLVDVLAVHDTPRARNVNALDEVPDSSWFQNRIDAIAADTAAFLRGACDDAAPDPAGPWTVVSGKPDGANPGFQVKDAKGQRYFFKPDGGRSRERQSVADFIGARVHYAAGFNTACTRIIYIQPSAFSISPKAKAENFVGDKVPFTPEMLKKVLDYGVKRSDGAVRGGLSQFLPGKPLGPWRDFGVRPDDPNDIIPHEDRRELRGSYILGALLSHYDAREQNSMDMWEAPGDDKPGYVKHFQLDFGDCLGSMSGWDRVTRRRGHVYEVEWPTAFVELVTFGLLPRPWRDPKMSPAGLTLGYYKAEPFDPEHYRTAYPFGPYARMTEADAAWGARILARITPEMIRALVASAELTDKLVERELVAALVGRREKLLQRYLTRLSPLARPRVDTGRLCVTDARIEGGLAVRGALTAQQAGRALAIERGRNAAESCVGPLPTSDDYTVVELRADGTHPLRVHLYKQDGAYQVAGIDRP